MTSELRPAVEVADDCWGEAEFCNIAASAAVIEADREAVRAEQAAEIELLKSHLEDAKEIIQKQIKQAAELAKFKALAETMAGALEQMHRAVCHETGFAEAVRADSGLAYPWEPLDVAADASLKAMREYKEARDA